MIISNEPEKVDEPKGSSVTRSRRAVVRYFAVLIIAVLVLLVFSYFASNRDAAAQTVNPAHAETIHEQMDRGEIIP